MAVRVHILSDHTSVLWSVEANTLDKAAAPPQDQKLTRAVVLRLTTTPRFSRSWSRQATWLCVKVALPTFQGLWETKAASNHRREADALLSRHPIQNGGANKREENKSVRHANKRRGSCDWQIKGGNKIEWKKWRIWRLHKGTEKPNSFLFVKLKVSCFHQINRLTMAWQQEGLNSVNCHVLHLVSFPAWWGLREMRGCGAESLASGRKRYQADIERGFTAQSFGGSKPKESTLALLLLGFRGDRPY